MLCFSRRCQIVRLMVNFLKKVNPKACNAVIKLFLEALNAGMSLWFDQRLVLNSYSSVKNRTLAMSDSTVAELNILKLMVVLGLAPATSLLLFLKEKLRIRL